MNEKLNMSLWEKKRRMKEGYVNQGYVNQEMKPYKPSPEIEKTIFDDLREMGRRLLQPKRDKDDGFYKMVEREIKKQKPKV